MLNNTNTITNKNVKIDFIPLQFNIILHDAIITLHRLKHNKYNYIFKKKKPIFEL